MFQPNSKCRVQLATGKTDLYGRPKTGAWVTVGCTVVRLKLTSEKTSVRADTSASRGNAAEMLADALVLVAANSNIKINDVLEIEGALLRVTGIQPRRDAMGRADHIEVTSTAWRKST